MTRRLTHAHIPGGGPAGATCDGCAHLGAGATSKAPAICWKAAQLAGVPADRLTAISRNSPACKYWTACGAAGAGIPHPERLVLSGALSTSKR